MFRLSICFIIAVCLSANASSKVVPLFLKDTLAVNNDSILWIKTSDNLNDYYRSGEVQVGIGTTTLHDSTFRLLHDANGNTNILINLYDLMRRYYAEQAAISGKPDNAKIGPEQAALAKRQGINWRIIPGKRKK